MMDPDHKPRQPYRIGLLYRFLLSNPVRTVVIGLLLFVLISVVGTIVLSEIILSPF